MVWLELSLNSQNIGVEGVSKLSERFESLKNLHSFTLGLSNNQIGDEGVSKLSQRF